MPYDELPAAVTASAPTSVQALMDLFIKNGEHIERVKFQKQVEVPNAPGRKVLRTLNVWDFIEDAIEGTGGFADGSYLVPFKRELQTTRPTDKFYERMELSDYDNFAKTIAEAPASYIVGASDRIQRESDGNKLLEDWWENVDGMNTSITDFMLGYPASQARAYGTAWIVMDNAPELKNERDEPSPYVCCVPSRRVVYWAFDSARALAGVVFYDPTRDEELDPKLCPVRVWTADGWALYRPGGGTNWALDKSGPNPLERVPIVRLHDEQPAPGKGMGKSIMLTVAKVARTVFNIDSEKRELERKCAFAMLAVPRKMIDPKNKLQVGTESLLEFDGEGGEPGWIEPDLTSIDKLMADRKEKRESAFSMAHMNAAMGHVETSSGFHSEVELDKTNRRTGIFAASLEAAEMDLVRLFQEFTKSGGEKASVKYPRDFGIRDLDKVYDRLKKRLDMGLGQADQEEALRDFYSAVYPRRPKEEIDDLAKGAAQSREENKRREEEAMKSSQQRALDLISKRRPGGAVERKSSNGR